MLALRRNHGRVLEPSCGDGAFLRHLPAAVGLELDPEHCQPGAQAIDFFAYPEREQFDTIVGNPPDRGHYHWQLPNGTAVIMRKAKK